GELLGQFGCRGGPPGQANQDVPPRLVAEGRERRYQRCFGHTVRLPDRWSRNAARFTSHALASPAALSTGSPKRRASLVKPVCCTVTSAPVPDGLTVTVTRVLLSVCGSVSGLTAIR